MSAKLIKNAVVKLGPGASRFGLLRGLLCQVTEVCENETTASYRVKTCSGRHTVDVLLPEDLLIPVPVMTVARLKVKGVID
jgi:hypothetical protein